MTVRECATTGVLGGDSYGIAAGNQGGKRQFLAHSPVQLLFAAGHVATIVQQLVDQRVHGEVFGNRGELFADAGKLGKRHAGIGLIGPFGAQEGGPVGGILVLVVGQHRLDSALAVFHELTVVFDQLIGFAFGQYALRHQLVGVDLTRAGVLAYALVHKRLSQRGGVLFVVAQLAEADDIDHDIVMELRAVIQRQLGYIHDGFGLVAIHVEHRRFDYLDHVGAIQRGTGDARVGGGNARKRVVEGTGGAGRVEVGGG